jgi:hypothetical protein
VYYGLFLYNKESIYLIANSSRINKLRIIMKYIRASPLMKFRVRAINMNNNTAIAAIDSS